MDMRDKIAEVIFEYVDTAPQTIDDVSDAILAALPDMIPDLVWVGAVAKLESGCYYTAVSTLSGKSFCVDYVYRGGSHCMGYYADFDKAKAAANAHHKAHLSRAMGWTA